MSETNKLINATADALVTTHERLMDTRDRVRDQARRVDKLADTERERLRASVLAGRLEDWASARLSPRRRRSGKLAELDGRIADLEARRGAITRETSEIRERIPQAEADHRAALARWHAEGARGSRPESEVPALEAKVQALQDDYAALEALLDEAFAAKVAWVESHRPALEKDAAAAVQEAAAGYRDAIARLADARDELIAARQDELWTKLYPDPAIRTGTAPNVPLVGGVVARLRSLVPGLQITLGAQELRRLLEADAEFVAGMVSQAQRDALRAADPATLRHDRDAIWTATPEGQEAMRRERQEARERYEREWGQKASW